jgi:FkbM family methyltransferase
MSITSETNRIFRKILGIEIHKTRASFDEARKNIINEKQITLVVDGGANEGQWASRLRRDGYRGKLMSIEPGSSAFKKLEATSRRDMNWEVLKCALGAHDEMTQLHLSSNDGMSSSLKQPGRHLDDFPTVTFSGTELVSVKTLEALLDSADERVLLKLDVQGFELEALTGIGKARKKIKAVEIEMTLIPMYQGEASLGRILSAIEDLGFDLFSISEFGKSARGQVSYFDVIAVSR